MQVRWNLIQLENALHLIMTLAFFVDRSTIEQSLTNAVIFLTHHNSNANDKEKDIQIKAKKLFE